MEKTLHRAESRGKAEHGWLTSRFSFSFADWYEPTRMGFGALRVINDDRIEPNTGFGAHAHRDMEIITIVTGGTVTHEDSMGNSGVVPAGDVQVMSAGSGVKHSEMNASLTEPLTLFQIWIESKFKGVPPQYGQHSFDLTNTKGLVQVVGSEALGINQEAYIYHARLDSQPLTYTLNDPAHGTYLFVIEGTVEVEGETLNARDALGVTGKESLSLGSSDTAKLLIIEVPME